MRIAFTGGGTGGHFYPLIAVAEEVRTQAQEQNIIDLELYYFGPTPYDEGLLYQNDITFYKVPAGKVRRYFSLMNIVDVFKTLWGIVVAIGRVFRIYPDVVFAKGGYASVPVLWACRLLFIPVVIHESDAIPGRANKWAGKFAKRVGVSFPEAIEYFPADKTAHTGQPVRKQIQEPLSEGSHSFFGISSDIPTILISGGSQGAEAINNIVIDALPALVSRYNVIHQAGERNAESVRISSDFILQHSEHKDRYKLYSFLDTEATRRSAGIADIVISRAGSYLFEISTWGIPSILVPIAHSGGHQKQNAFLYSRSGACTVIGENNLTENILIAEINRILSDEQAQETMRTAARAFNKPGAARTIALECLELALEHYS